jgi:hypothetical protein
VSILIPLAAVAPATAATSAPIPNCPRQITNADNGATIAMVQGSCATLQLDEKLNWDVPKSSSSAVGVFDTETFVPDQAWGLRANHAGSATITSEGRPDCDPGEVCPLYIVTFTVHFKVVSPLAGAA